MFLSFYTQFSLPRSAWKCYDFSRICPWSDGRDTLFHVREALHYVGQMLSHVREALHYVGRMLSHVRETLHYVGRMSHVREALPRASKTLSHVHKILSQFWKEM